MIVLEIGIETTMLTARGIRDISRTVNRLEMTNFRNERLPRHFENNADTKGGGAYGYRVRTKGTQIKKAKEFGTTAPLVRKGTLRQRVLATAKITATDTRGTMKARASTRTPISQDVVREIEAVSDEEARGIAKRWGETFAVLATQPKFKRKKRVRDSKGRFT